MPVHIYNSLSKNKEEFVPLDPGNVNMYSCGVTVYDDCHLGHGRSLYIFDVIRRYLKYRGFQVRFVRNITDIDDKIINRAAELGCDWSELVEKHIGNYRKDLSALGLEAADFEPRATENIPEMISHIGGLIDKRYAYITGTGVYFSVRKFKGYGKLSGQSLDQMLSGVRKDADETKADPLDFALWKRSKTGEPSWPSPWGEGRPGWHIECSVMSTKYLGAETLDIHSGGRDLIFPHHENEIAQSESLTGNLFAKYWIHHGLLTINGQKMSKSSGNFVTISDFIAKYKDSDLLKLFFLSAHYSHPVDYTEEKIKEARKAYERIEILIRRLSSYSKVSCGVKPGPAAAGAMKRFKLKFIECMDDDFNTPRALSVIFDAVNDCNKLLDSRTAPDDPDLGCAVDKIKEMACLFGLNFLKGSALEGISVDEIGLAIKKRLEFKKGGNFAQADRIRRELEEKNIILEDSKEGTSWRKKI